MITRREELDECLKRAFGWDAPSLAGVEAVG